MGKLLMIFQTRAIDCHEILCQGNLEPAETVNAGAEISMLDDSAEAQQLVLKHTFTCSHAQIEL